jgi:hypothetical protein
MKNFLIALTVLFFSATILSSCKKAYRCSCQSGQIINAYTHKLNKSDADAEKAKCEKNAGCTFERDK